VRRGGVLGCSARGRLAGWASSFSSSDADVMRITRGADRPAGGTSWRRTTEGTRLGRTLLTCVQKMQNCKCARGGAVQHCSGVAHLNHSSSSSSGVNKLKMSRLGRAHMCSDSTRDQRLRMHCAPLPSFEIPASREIPELLGLSLLFRHCHDDVLVFLLIVTVTRYIHQTKLDRSSSQSSATTTTRRISSAASSSRPCVRRSVLVNRQHTR
jgi:hypothetical protein